MSSVQEAVASNPDYTDQVRRAFDQLVLLTLRFARDRQDRQPSSGDRRRLAYLFDWGSGSAAPHEKELGFDYRDFLVGSQLARTVQAEVRDVAGGRADVVIDLFQFRFVVELKREFEDVTPAGLRRYLGQASLYSGTDVHLGILLVLDLTDKSRGVASFRDNVWVDRIARPSERVRDVVVVRVPGRRIDPSATRSPSI